MRGPRVNCPRLSFYINPLLPSPRKSKPAMPFTDATLPELPDFDSLTLDPNGPPGNTWGLFGKDDELGMLNLLTPETVAAAAKEIKTGIRISLDLPLNQPNFPSFDRQPFHHEIRQRGADRCVNDDIVHFNTQSSSQWDGFRHYGPFSTLEINPHPSSNIP